MFKIPTDEPHSNLGYIKKILKYFQFSRILHKFETPGAIQKSDFVYFKIQ